MFPRPLIPPLLDRFFFRHWSKIHLLATCLFVLHVDGWNPSILVQGGSQALCPDHGEKGSLLRLFHKRGMDFPVRSPALGWVGCIDPGSGDRESSVCRSGRRPHRESDTEGESTGPGLVGQICTLARGSVPRGDPNPHGLVLRGYRSPFCEDRGQGSRFHHREGPSKGFLPPASAIASGGEPFSRSSDREAFHHPP